MAAVLHHYVIRCEACGRIVLEAKTYYADEPDTAGWFCADTECIAQRKAS